MGPTQRGTRDYFNLAHHMLQLHQLNAPFLIFYFILPSHVVKKHVREKRERPRGLTYGGLQTHFADSGEYIEL